MKPIATFKLDKTRTISVEIDDLSPRGGKVRASRGGRIMAEAQSSFAAAIESIRPMAATLIEKLSDIPARPSEVEVEFGVKLTAESGIVITSASVEGNFTIKLKWSSSENGVKAER